MSVSGTHAAALTALFYRLQDHAKMAQSGRCNSSSGTCGLDELSEDRLLRLAISRGGLWNLADFVNQKHLNEQKLGQYILDLWNRYDFHRDTTVNGGVEVQVTLTGGDQTQTILDDHDQTAWEAHRPSFVAACLLSILVGGTREGEVYLFYPPLVPQTSFQQTAPISTTTGVATLLMAIAVITEKFPDLGGRSKRAPGLVIQPLRSLTGQQFKLDYQPEVNGDPDLTRLAKAVDRFLKQSQQPATGQQQVPVPAVPTWSPPRGTDDTRVRGSSSASDQEIETWLKNATTDSELLFPRLSDQQLCRFYNQLKSEFPAFDPQTGGFSEGDPPPLEFGPEFSPKFIRWLRLKELWQLIKSRGLDCDARQFNLTLPRGLVLLRRLGVNQCIQRYAQLARQFLDPKVTDTEPLTDELSELIEAFLQAINDGILTEEQILQLVLVNRTISSSNRDLIGTNFIRNFFTFSQRISTELQNRLVQN